MKILELFSGYGTATFALKRLGIKTEIVGYSDIDKYANQCFAQNHSGKQLGDVKLINPNELEDFDLLTGGFPCQAFSNAGKMQGELDPRGTLFFEIIRIAEVKKPKYMLLENVKGLTCKKFKDTFDKILSELARIGYKVHWKVLNTKDYGIPQSRARVWFVCFREQEDYDKFKFPEQEDLKIKLKDILEKEVDEKYNISEKMFNGLLRHNENHINKGTGFLWKPRDINSYASCLRNRGAFAPTDNSVILDLYNHKIVEDGTCPTLSNPCHNNIRLLELKTNTQKGYDEAVFGDGIRLEQINSKTGRGRVIKQLSGTLQCNNMRGVVTEDLRIRKLTPKEFFRLQGFLNDEINLEGLSDTQRYKLAGNGQSVNVVEKIFHNMFS